MFDSIRRLGGARPHGERPQSHGLQPLGQSGAARPDGLFASSATARVLDRASIGASTAATVPGRVDIDAVQVPGQPLAFTPTAPAAELLAADGRSGFFGDGVRIDGRRIEEDLEDTTRRLGGQEAFEALADNRDAAGQAYMALSPDQRQMADVVLDAVLPPSLPDRQQDFAAGVAIQRLLIEGRMTGGPQSAEGRDLLGELHRAATRPLMPGIDRTEMLGQLVREIAFPSSISQETSYTCGPTALQMYMAHEEPAELARIVGDLASPEGTARLRNNDVIARDTTRWDNRSIPTQLFTDAVMEYGDSATSWDSARRKLSSGSRAINSERLVAMQSAMTLGDHQNVGRSDIATPISEATRARIEQAAGRGEPIPVGLFWADSGREHGQHAVLLMGIEGDRVRIENPWGQEETLPADAFFGRLIYASLPSS